MSGLKRPEIAVALVGCLQARAARHPEQAYQTPRLVQDFFADLCRVESPLAQDDVLRACDMLESSGLVAFWIQHFANGKEAATIALTATGRDASADEIRAALIPGFRALN